MTTTATRVRLRDHIVTCDDCHGSGRIVIDAEHDGPGSNYECDACNGYGRRHCENDVCGCKALCTFCGSMDCRLAAPFVKCNACGLDAFDGEPLTPDEVRFAEEASAP